eukprot:gene17037-biopygen2294
MLRNTLAEEQHHTIAGAMMWCGNTNNYTWPWYSSTALERQESELSKEVLDQKCDNFRWINGFSVATAYSVDLCYPTGKPLHFNGPNQRSMQRPNVQHNGLMCNKIQ